MPRQREKSRSETHRFVGMIYRVGILRCVSVPEEVCARLAPGRTRTLPVVATVAGQTLRTTLMPAGGGSFRLFLNGAMRKASGADAGDPVGVSLRLDRASREMAVPADFAAALSRAPEARSYFVGKTTALRREVLRYIEQAKAPATRARRIGNCVRVLTARAKKQSQRAR